MDVSGHPWRLRAVQRWQILLPFLLALAALTFLGWIVFLNLALPYDGIAYIFPSGLISEIEPKTAADHRLQPGDVLLSIDGEPGSLPYYRGKQVGDMVRLEVNRDGRTIPVALALGSPSRGEVLRRLMPLIAALFFWMIGVGVEAFKAERGEFDIFFLWCLTSAVALALGSLSSMGSMWGASLFRSFLWLLGPVSVHFHLHFPQEASFRGRKVLMVTLYSLALLGGGSSLLWGAAHLQLEPWTAILFSSGRVFLALNLLTVIILIVHDYFHATQPGARSRIRLIGLGAGLSALPLITLTVLPDALIQQPILPNHFAFLLLVILPLTYGYAIFRHRLIEIEKHINRGATLILVYSVLGAFYLILYVTLRRWLPLTVAGEPLVNTLLVLILVGVLAPMREQAQRLVDKVFYGGWYDYRKAIAELTQGVEQIMELSPLAQTISERLVKILHLETTCVFFRDIGGDFSVVFVTPPETANRQQATTFPTLPRTSLAYLLKIGAVERTALRKQLTEITLSPEELQLLNSEQVYLWVPILGHGQVQGLLALGPKVGGDIFSGEDLDIVRTVARGLSPVIENIHLLTQLRQHAAELELRVQERTAELHDAKERVEAILASVGDGVIVIDLEGAILSVNSAFEEQSLFSASELLGQRLFERLAHQNDPLILDGMRNSLQHSEVWGGELKTRRKDGSIFDVQLTLAPVRDQGGQVVSYVGSQRDITRQKELDRLKDVFVSDVSHELRTPTTNIGLYLELLEDAQPEKRGDYLAVIRDQVYLLRQLVEDILDLSRLTMKKVRRNEFQPVNLNHLTGQILLAHQPLAEASGLRLAFEPGAELPPVCGEQNQLARVVTNLVSNAIRYTPAGEVCLRTFAVNGQVWFEVRDTGIGIDPSDLPHLFERFYRGQQVRQSNIHGSGLGLAIVKEIVDLHDGQIKVQSECGRGTNFAVGLPRWT